MNLPLIIKDMNDGKVVYIEIYINNIKSLFLFDTGSSVTVINKRNIDKYTTKLPTYSYNVSGVGDNVQSYKINIDKFEIGNIIYNDKIFQTFDLIYLNNMLSSNYVKLIDGILGNDIIFDIVDNIDIGDKQIKIKEEH